MTEPIFAHAGLAALRTLTQQPSALCFDLDGTLAPIVPVPSEAAVPASTARLLRALAAHWPVAVLTGRTLIDAEKRLGFTPRYLVGSHGAEWPDGRYSDGLSRDLGPCRQHLHRHRSEWEDAGVELEDKRLSLALHYRRAPEPGVARRVVDGLMSGLATGLRIEHGHFVLNITSAAAPDKGDALLELMRQCGATRALVVGDDTNDEPAFRKAPEGSVTLRVGATGAASHARFHLDEQSESDELLFVLLRLLG